MNRQKLSLFLIAAGIITTLAAYALFFFVGHVAEDPKFGSSILWFGDLLLSILVMGCFSLLPFVLMGYSFRLSRERRYGSLLVTLALFLMIPTTGLYFIETLRGGKYNKSYGQGAWFMTPGDECIVISGILHWFTAIVTLVIAGLSRAIEKNQPEL